MPTRLTDTSATLIDNVFSNINFPSSGLLVSNLSENFPYFYTTQTSHTVKNNVKKYIYYRKDYDYHFQKINNDLESLDLTNLLQKYLDSDPNFNYNKLDFILDKLFIKHMPVRKIKLNKYRHKKSEWITPEIIRSIKFRDNIYKRLKQTSQFNYQFFQLKQNLKVYDEILKRIIREAKL